MKSTQRGNIIEKPTAQLHLLDPSPRDEARKKSKICTVGEVYQYNLIYKAHAMRSLGQKREEIYVLVHTQGG